MIGSDTRVTGTFENNCAILERIPTVIASAEQSNMRAHELVRDACTPLKNEDRFHPHAFAIAMKYSHSAVLRKFVRCRRCISFFGITTHVVHILLWRGLYFFKSSKSARAFI